MKRSIIILAAFALFFVTWYFDIPMHAFSGLREQSGVLSYTLNYLLSALPILAALFLLHKPREVLASMGLAHGFGTGLLFAAVATLPMLIGYATIGAFNTELSIDKSFRWIILAGFFEEIMFRGFAFGQLFRYARWGFLTAGLSTALLFGALHLYQGHDLTSALESFGITALGGLFFSWIYVEWNYNLWTAIWLHILMNAPWILFQVSDSGAAGGVVVNLLRILTIALAIGLTVIYKKQKALPYFITTKKL